MVTGRVSASVAVSSKQFQLDGGQLHHDRLSVLNKSARCLARIVASAVKRFLSFWLLLSRQPCSPTARRAQRPAQRWRPQEVRVRGQLGFRHKGQGRRGQRGQRGQQHKQGQRKRGQHSRRRRGQQGCPR